MRCEHCQGRGCPICTPPLAVATKPPVGLRPKKYSDSARREEILAAMKRYSHADKPIPLSWIEELKTLIFDC